MELTQRKTDKKTWSNESGPASNLTSSGSLSAVCHVSIFQLILSSAFSRLPTRSTNQLPINKVIEFLAQNIKKKEKLVVGSSMQTYKLRSHSLNLYIFLIQ